MAVNWWDVTVGNVTYKGVAGRSPVIDGFEIGLIRYIVDWESRTGESYFWADGTWVKFPAGGKFGTVRVHFTAWPDGAYEVVKLVQEPEAKEALTAAIDAAAGHSQEGVGTDRDHGATLRLESF